MIRNPNWTRDELILALDLYFRVNPIHTSEKHSEIVALSDLLNNLPIHAQQPNKKFRNPNGVYMKMCNFLRLDPNYLGKGLDAGSQLDIVIWNEFAKDRGLLQKTAAAIRHNYPAVPQSSELSLEDHPADTEEFPEGRILTRLHKMRERNSTVVKRKKQAVLSTTGTLACEVCNFDFARVYGELGIGFAECHHTVPISELEYERKTRPDDLAIVCANCHRMLHRARPTLTVEQLRKIISL